MPIAPERLSCEAKARHEHACDCRPCKFGEHCGDHWRGCHRSCTGTAPGRRFGRFLGYRPRETYRPNIGRLPPGEPRFEGCVFSDGTCILRWRGKVKSTSEFRSFTAMMKAHGHPEYGTVIIWLDEPDGTSSNDAYLTPGGGHHAVNGPEVDS